MTLSNCSVALVTGASSGIGAAVVRRMCAQGVQVHALARRKKRLAELSRSTGCHVHAVDLQRPDQIYQELSGLQVDVLINNAGVGRGIDSLLEASPDDIAATIDTNVQAALHVIRAVTPSMVSRGFGHLVNVGSVAGLYPVVSAIYGASKGAIHLMSQNLRLELAGTGVRVTEICPGRVQTEFYDAAIDDPGRREQIKQTNICELQPDDVAESILFAVNAPRHVNVNLIEIQPIDQLYGGVRLARTPQPVSKPDDSAAH